MATKSKLNPGFAAFIAKKKGVSKDGAGDTSAASSGKASPDAKKANKKNPFAKKVP